MDSHQVNQYTSTIVFKAKDRIKGLRTYYSDLQMLGRHFLLKSSHFPQLRRYYTICNCLIPVVYIEYMRVVIELTHRNNVCQFDESLYDELDSHTVALTVKNYNKRRGMS